MNVELLLKPVIGAVIGYSTNWLAIKMLFRPYTEKRIGKVRLPFTPGLIPRERGRIARSLGTAVGEKLLTEEVIRQELLSDQVMTHIKGYVVNDLLDQDVSLSDFFGALLKEHYEPFVEKYQKLFAGSIRSYLEAWVTSDEFKASVTHQITQRVPYNQELKQWLTQPSQDKMIVLLDHQYEGVMKFVTDQLNKEGVKVKMGQLVNDLLMEKVGPLGAMFVNADELAGSIVVYLQDLLNKEETKTTLLNTGREGLNLLSRNELADIVEMKDYIDGVEATTVWLMKQLVAYLNEFDLSRIIESLTSSLLSSKIQLSAIEKEHIEDQVEHLYRAFVLKNIPTFLETFQVAKIVENEIEQFSVQEVEGLIFNIIDKELKTITWLGGLLGFIIGLVYIIL